MRRGVAAVVRGERGLRRQEVRRTVRLGHAAVAALGELANVVEKDRFLGGGEMRSVLGDLGQEGIVEEDGGSSR